MTLSRIGTGASLVTIILTVWLGACGTNDDSEPCGQNGLLNGTCQPPTATPDTCSGAQIWINVSAETGEGACPTNWNCCLPPGSLDAGAPPASGDSGPAGSGSGADAHS